MLIASSDHLLLFFFGEAESEQRDIFPSLWEVIGGKRGKEEGRNKLPPIGTQ